MSWGYLILLYIKRILPTPANRSVKFKKKKPCYFSSPIFSRGRGAQSERPVSVSGGAVHAANHSVPWLRSKHRSRKSQRSPQCTEVPQNHGWREVISLATAQTQSHRHTMGWIAVLDTGSTFVIDLNNMKIPQNFGPWNIFGHVDVLFLPMKIFIAQNLMHLTFCIFGTNNELIVPQYFQLPFTYHSFTLLYFQEFENCIFFFYLNCFLILNRAFLRIPKERQTNSNAKRSRTFLGIVSRWCCQLNNEKYGEKRTLQN